MPNVDRKPLNTLLNTDVEKAASIAKDAFSRRRGLLIIGNCVVDYRGRASSKLEAGERIAVFKEDGSVSVHRPVGNEPVNWQPPGCVLHAGVADDTLYVIAVRKKPSESVKVSFDRIYLLSVLNLVDRGEFALHASEEDMQKAVLLMPSLIEDGLKTITHEKKVESGFIDVYCEDKAGRFVVIEIKRKTASKQAAFQLANYVEAIRNIVNKDVRGVLASPNVSKGVPRLLATLGLEFKALDPKKCAGILRKTETRRLQEFFKEE